MTLINFKKRLKITVLFTVLMTYGLSAFALGKVSVHTAPQLVKGISAQSQPESQLERPQPYADVQSAQVIASYVKLCSNTAYSYSVSYPKDWFTTYNDKYQECIYFAPYSFVVPLYVEHDIVPIHIEPVPPEEWQSLVKLYENPNDFQNVVSSKNTEINGRAVKEIDSIATGNGFVTRGFVKKSYLIFDSQTPLLIYYQQLSAAEDIAGMENVLKDIVQSLKYF